MALESASVRRKAQAGRAEGGGLEGGLGSVAPQGRRPGRRAGPLGAGRPAIGGCADGAGRPRFGVRCGRHPRG